MYMYVAMCVHEREYVCACERDGEGDGEYYKRRQSRVRTRDVQFMIQK